MAMTRRLLIGSFPFLAVSAFALLVGCGGESPSASTREAASSSEQRCRGCGHRQLTVMTRNLYLGANLDPITLEQDPFLIPVRVSEAWAQVKGTNFPERATAIAREIARSKPDLIGLQEVALWRIQSPGDFLAGNPTPNATEVVYDFLEILLRNLAARGLSYAPVAAWWGFEAELPDAEGNDIRFNDRDVVLARSGLQTFDPRSGTYQAAAEVSVGGTLTPIARGWTSVGVKMEGQTFRFLNTHLEGQEGPPGEIQVEQAEELVAIIAAEPLPMVLVGDLNSRGDDTGSATHHILLEAGLTDTWKVLRPNDPGFTDAQAADLLNPVSLLFQRLDHVLFRGALGPVAIRRVGASPADRTSSGLWPSDHAGVVATFRLESNGRDN